MPSVWQVFDDRCQVCHSWQDRPDRTVPAMTLLLGLAVLAAGLVLGTVEAVRNDGYGRRPDRDDRTAAPQRYL
jgi:hypothetical protein